MFDYKNFDHVFGHAAPLPDRAYHQETEAFRRSFDGVLFIDRVLKALGITKGESRDAVSTTLTEVLRTAQQKYTPPGRRMPSARSTSTSATPA